MIGTSRNFLHRKFGAYCLIDTVVTNLELDGYDGRTESGSTAEMAKWLGLPVLLVVDARSMARSASAIRPPKSTWSTVCPSVAWT